MFEELPKGFNPVLVTQRSRNIADGELTEEWYRKSKRWISKTFSVPRLCFLQYRAAKNSLHSLIKARAGM